MSEHDEAPSLWTILFLAAFAAGVWLTIAFGPVPTSSAAPKVSPLSTGQSRTEFLLEDGEVTAGLVTCGAARCISWDGKTWRMHLANDRCDWQPGQDEAGTYELDCKEPGGDR